MVKRRRWRRAKAKKRQAQTQVKKKKIVMKMIKPNSSSDDEEEEIAMLIKRMEKALKKLNSKGVPITIEEIEHNRQRKKERRGGCFGCGEKGHYMDSCPIIAKEKKNKEIGTRRL
ncbi:hypothetical protein U9M48_011494 [Paspalum notatum var. saurae]|uniref:CCHC-type domain-containing protein n=1 Tax=Paspalum notatum var. saurae TaxID=547442 RepID=A0AAQ3WH71_PASNO